MSAFTEKLIVSLEKDGKHWQLEKEFEYYTEIFGDRKYIQIPKGFTTDFASIPKIFHSFIEDRDKYNKAAVVHDYLYSSKMFDRKTSDRIFLEAMEVVGISKFKRYLFYLTVRLFGWLYWRGYV
ncbi:DUF1353 domain-containing protein [Hydrogenivirga sp. 128-5-R1-1]|uniref:DUF1353 domain-containing protein n=1 Tax=Hydrogenivirga sp. 128-5-R1-1 TaxID=392423 RepID=UPI00015EF717|nr:DUF1353 domain-containing protein [Hydrogenivirga sp. 128-5-R1-1]EDP74401.1 hypothetical protein HG1285_12882 [Hydrogenivirga sp. 128-5-R1-1]